MTTHTLADLVFSPNPTAERLQMMRNMLACQLESARMMAVQAPFGANMILELAIDGMLQYHLWQASQTLPPDADLLTALDRLDRKLGCLVRCFYAETDLEARLSLADLIAEATIQPCECAEDDMAAFTGKSPHPLT